MPAATSKPQLPPGAITIPLTLSPSGHQLLAVDAARGTHLSVSTPQPRSQHEDHDEENDEDSDSDHHHDATHPVDTPSSTALTGRRNEGEATSLPTIIEENTEHSSHQGQQTQLMTSDTPIPNPRWLTTKDVHKKIIAEVEPLIMTYSPPLAPQRTNVFSEQFQTRSQTLGAYSVRGLGITKATFELMEKHPQLLPSIHRLASTRKENTAYLAVQVTEQHTGLPVHHDAKNESLTSIIALGNFTMGWIYIQHD
eukprot:6460367-Amphidinium_carterae.1